MVDAEIRLTGLSCPRLRTRHSKLTCCNHSSAVRNRSSARSHSWLRSRNRSSCGHGRSCRYRRASSNDDRKDCSSSTHSHSSARNRSFAHKHSSIRKRSSTHKHSWLRSSRSSSSCGTGPSGHPTSSNDEHKDCSTSHSRSSARNHSFVHKHSSTRSHSHSCCRRTDRRRHSRFRPSRAP